MENTQSEINPPNTNSQKNAILMALANILIFGAPYLALHSYGRFFLASLLLIISLFTFPIASVVIAFFVIIDTYFLALRANKEVTQKKKNTFLNILGVITIIAYIGLYTAINNFPGQLAWSKDACKYLYPFNEISQTKCSSQFQEKQDLALINGEIKRMDDSKKTDPICEGLLKEDHIFGEYCYLKKAFDTNDGLYCYGSSNKEYCIFYLAAKTGDSKYCDLTAPYSKNECLRYSESQGRVFQFYDSCDHFSEPDRKAKCEKLFSSFFESIKTEEQARTAKKIKRN